MDRGAWQARVHGPKELDTTQQLTLSLHFQGNLSARSERHWLCILKEDIAGPRYKEHGSEEGEASEAFCSAYITYTRLFTCHLSISLQSS